jgi:hypothetical protein
MSLSSIYRPNEDISNPSLESVLAKLAVMNTDQLKAFAAQNQDDMIMLGAAQAVHAKREEFAQRANAPQGGNMPPVNQQVVQNMDPAPQMPQGGQGMPPQGMPPQGGGPLPEQQGIAQLPAPNIQNMAGGGIVAFADGGYADEDAMSDGEPVLRFANRGLVGGFEAQIREEATRQGIDPDLAVRLFMTESAGKKDAVSPKGAAGLGQLMIPAAKEMGLSPQDRFDPNKNIPASVGYLKKQLNKYGGDPEKALAAYNWGPGNVDKHLAKNEGQLNRTGLPKETADYLTKILPMGTAIATEPKAKNLASQIPGQSMQAPASTYDQQNSYFGGLADRLGIPQEYQRNISNTLNALGGYASPVSRVNRAVGMASNELAATPEMIAKAQQAKQIAETPRLLPPAKAGLEALDEASQATRASAEAARRARNLEQDVQAARAAEQSVNAANATSKIARTAEEGIAAIPNAQALNAAKAANAARTLSATQFAEQQLGGRGAPEANPLMNLPAVRPDEFGMAEPEKKAIIEAAKEVTPAKERKGFDAEDLLVLGLGLMTSKSPRFLTALGEAGLQTLANKKDREKGAADKLYKEALITQANRPSADVQMIEKYASDPKFREAYDQFAQSKREPMTRETLAKTWSTNIMLQQMYPNFEDYIKMAASAMGGGASGTQLSAADQSLVQKYLR